MPAWHELTVVAMELSAHRRPTTWSNAQVILFIIAAAYLCAYMGYRTMGPVKADYGFSRRTKHVITTTDPATGQTSTTVRVSMVCGSGPPRMRADNQHER